MVGDFNCSNCKEKVPFLYVKCSKHTYKICAACSKQSKQCPSCKSVEFLPQKVNQNCQRIENVQHPKQIIVEPALENGKKGLRQIIQQLDIDPASKDRLLLQIQSESKKQQQNLSQSFQCQLQKQKQLLKQKYDNQVDSFKKQSQNQKNKLVRINQDERQHFENQIKILNSELSEKNVLISKYGDQKTQIKSQNIQARQHLQNGFKAHKEELENFLQNLNEKSKNVVQINEAQGIELKNIKKQNERKQAEHQLQISNFTAERSRFNKKLTFLQAENEELIRKLSFYPSNSKFDQIRDSLRSTQSQAEVQKLTKEFDSIIQKMNLQLIEQLKFLDGFYDSPSPEIIKMTHLIIKQYKDLTFMIRHPLLDKMLAQKSELITNFIETQMDIFSKNEEQIELVDFSVANSLIGKKIKRYFQIIRLLQSLESKEINNSIQKTFIKKLSEKFQISLENHNKLLLCNIESKSEFNLIKLIDEYYLTKEILQTELKMNHLQSTDEQNKIEQTIRLSFNRFKQNFNQLKDNKPSQELEKFNEEALRLQNFIQVLNHSKKHIHFKTHLEKYLGMKEDKIKSEILNILSTIKQQLKEKLENLMETKVYRDCFRLEKVFNKLKILDQILTKEQNQFYNFDFANLHSKILHFLKLLKIQKINKAHSLITQSSINLTEFQKEYESIECNLSIKQQYFLRLRNILEIRTTTLSKIGQDLQINWKTLQLFQQYYTQFLNIEKFLISKKLMLTIYQKEICQDKVYLIFIFFDNKFKEYYWNSRQFKDLGETQSNIVRLSKFQLFYKHNFPIQYRKLKESIIQRHYAYLPALSDHKQNVFQALLKLNTNSQQILNKIIYNADSPISEEYIQYYTNMISQLPITQGLKIEKKIQMNVNQSINQLQKEWLSGILDSENQRILKIKISKLRSQQTLIYHQLINYHKNKILQERQQKINDETQKLQFGGLTSLQTFIEICQQHHQKNTKFYKLYFTILEDFIFSIFRNLKKEDKLNYLTETLYRLDFAKIEQGIQNIFRSYQYQIYLSDNNFTSLKDSINCIDSFDGKNEQFVLQVINPLVNAFKIYSVFKQNEEKSLLEEKDKQDIKEAFKQIKNQVKNNYLNLCQRLDYQNMFEVNCDRFNLLLTFVKIEIYLKLINKIHSEDPYLQFKETVKVYDNIVEVVNMKINKIFDNIRKFQFYKEEYDTIDYSIEDYLSLLRQIDQKSNIFKEIRYHHDKIQNITKNKYLHQLNLKKVDQQQITSIINMAWAREYKTIKQDISNRLRSHGFQHTQKYRFILQAKQMVRSEHLHSFTTMIKQEYDFKKIVIQQILKSQEKTENYLSQLWSQTHQFNIKNRQMKEKRMNTIDKEKKVITQRFQNQVKQIENSFHQIKSEQVRRKKIQIQINSLQNHFQSTKILLAHTDLEIIQHFRAKYAKRHQATLRKFCETLDLIKKLSLIFDDEIEEFANHKIQKIQSQINHDDKHLKNEMIIFAEKYLQVYVPFQSKDSIIHSTLRNTSRNNGLSKDHQRNSFCYILIKCPEIKQNLDLKNKLIQSFEEYHAQLTRIERQFYEFRSQTSILKLIRQTKEKAKQLSPYIVIARIYAVYEVGKYIDSHHDEIIYENLKVNQVLAIFLLIDAQNQQNTKLGHRLIQLSPGQGKSRVIAGLNCYLALIGYQVYSGCLTPELARRDEKVYHPLFASFGVETRIIYSKCLQFFKEILHKSGINKLFQLLVKINSSQQLNNNDKQFLQNGYFLNETNNCLSKILVIDEIETLFDENDFTKKWIPQKTIRTPEVISLINFIWKSRQNENLQLFTKDSNEYRNLSIKFPYLQQLLWNQVESLITSFKAFLLFPKINDQEVSAQKLSKEMKVELKYCEIYASCQKYEKGSLSKQNCEQHMSLVFKIGEFSYYELPKYFNRILAISSPIQKLSKIKKDIIKQEYRISDIFHMPTIYGSSHIQQNLECHSCYQYEYSGYFLSHLLKIRKMKRPIVIFFENEEKLNVALHSPQLKKFETDTFKLSNQLSQEVSNFLIENIGTMNRITLTTSAFVAGADFKIIDRKINELGGLHLILTYIPKNQSDFNNILGRICRRGDNGSVEMIITVEELQKRSVKLVEDEHLYKAIQQTWKAFDEKEGIQLTKYVKGRSSSFKALKGIQSMTTMSQYSIPPLAATLSKKSEIPEAVTMAKVASIT